MVFELMSLFFRRNTSSDVRWFIIGGWCKHKWRHNSYCILSIIIHTQTIISIQYYKVDTLFITSIPENVWDIPTLLSNLHYNFSVIDNVPCTHFITTINICLNSSRICVCFISILQLFIIIKTFSKRTFSTRMRKDCLINYTLSFRFL